MPLIHFATRAAGPLRAGEYQRRAPGENWTINDSAAGNGALTINLIICFASLPRRARSRIVVIRRVEIAGARTRCFTRKAPNVSIASHRACH